jgi:MFS family permease
MSALMSSFILRRASTKVLFVICYSVVIVSDISLATFSYLKSNMGDDETLLDSFGWLPVVLVTTIVSAHSIGVYPVLQVLMGELFPSDIRSLAIGLTISAALCCSTANMLLYPFLIESFSFFGTFYFYAATAFVTMLWGVFNIPDNRGLSLAKVEEKFSSANLEKRQLDQVE